MPNQRNPCVFHYFLSPGIFLWPIFYASSLSSIIHDLFISLPKSLLYADLTFSNKTGRHFWLCIYKRILANANFGLEIWLEIEVQKIIYMNRYFSYVRYTKNRYIFCNLKLFMPHFYRYLNRNLHHLLFHEI